MQQKTAATLVREALGDTVVPRRVREALRDLVLYGYERGYKRGAADGEVVGFDRGFDEAKWGDR